MSKPLLSKISVPECETDISLRNNAINWIDAIRIIDVEAGLKLTNSLLKLEIVEWHDIYGLFFLVIVRRQLRNLGFLD